MVGLRSGSMLRFCRPDLGPNCLQKLSADDIRRYRVNSQMAVKHVLIGRVENIVDPDQLVSEKPADLDLHCF